jgi:hypothetical protein
MWRAKRCCSIGLRAALLIKILLVVNVVCFAQTDNTPPAATKPSVDKPLTSDERAELLKLIRSLQERVEKLEAGQAGSEKSGADKSVVPSASTESPAPTPSEQPPNTEAPAPVEAKPAAQDDEDKFNGRYTPNLGFKLANTEYGDLNVSIYTYVRYLNQLGLDPTYTDALGNTRHSAPAGHAAPETPDQVPRLDIKSKAALLPLRLDFKRESGTGGTSRARRQSAIHLQ